MGMSTEGPAFSALTEGAGIGVSNFPQQTLGNDYDLPPEE